MKRSTVAALTLLVALGVFGLYRFYPYSVSAGNAERQETAMASGQPGGLAAAAGATTAPSAAAQAKRDTGIAAALQSEIMSEADAATQLFDSDPRLAALSEDEAAWLEKHYYPTPEDLARLSELDTEALRGTNDPRMAMLHGLALLEQGNIGGAMAVLRKAATLGSIYAWEQLGIANYNYALETLGGDPIGDHAIILMAHLEVARMLGDHNAQYLMDQYLPSFDHRRNAYAVQRQVAEFMRQFGEGARLLGVPPPGPDPRPNAGLWQDLYELYRLQLLPPPNQKPAPPPSGG